MVIICLSFVVQGVVCQMDSKRMLWFLFESIQIYAVSWVDDDGEIKEAPIPEQFMHKLVNGSVSSQVSDLYH